MSIYEDLIYGVEEGKPFRISLEKSSAWLNGKAIIKNGEYNGTLHPTLLDMAEQDVITEIERLYKEYKYSLPNRRSKDKYFKALPYEELSDWDMVNGELREIAQAKLEGFVLCAKLLSKINFNGWFWKSNADKDLVILKAWVA